MTSVTSSRDSLLRKTAIAVCTACVLIIVGTLVLLNVPTFRRLVAGDPHTGYVVGDKVDVAINLFDQSPYTVLVFARTTCAVCESSMPVLAHLASALPKDSSVRIFIVKFEAREAPDLYAARLGIDARQIVTLAPEALETMKLQIVPTVLVVNKTGTILFRHTGLVDASAENSVLGLVGHG